ncbi:MAG: NUDIX domain-containing protein [bacterium]
MVDNVVFRGELIALTREDVRLPNGVEMTVEAVRHPGAAAVVAYEHGDVILVRQFRPVIGEYVLELPAGKVERGHDLLETARRELREETGYEAASLEPLVTIYSAPGYSDERVAIFIGRELSSSQSQLDDQEILSVIRIPLADAVRRTSAGEITDAKTVCGLLLAQKALEGNCE